MSGGYRDGPPPTDLAPLIEELDDVQRRLATLERPSGEQLAQAVAELQSLVNNLDQRIDDYIANEAYTKAQVDNKVANPGNISPGTVTASGTVSSGGDITASGTVSGNYGGNFPAGLKSTGAYNTDVTGGGAYRAMWIHNDGRIGYAPSSRKFKEGFKPVKLTVEKALELQGFYFRYLASVPYDQEQQKVMIGLLAEDTHAAGFHFLVDYDEDGKPFGIRNDLLSVVVLEGMRDFFARFTKLAERVATLEGVAPNIADKKA